MLCPLCLKECVTTEVAGLLPPTYTCGNAIEINKGDYRAHFQRYASGSWSYGIYYRDVAIILPYRVVSHYEKQTSGTVYEDKQEQKRIEHLPNSTISILKEATQFSFGIMSFEKILETPLIHMDIEEKLLERIKLILLLS